VASIFSRIIQGEIPGRFVWSDDQCVGFLTIGPIKPGHTLVVPRLEVDHWLDLDPSLMSHLTGVSHAVGKGLERAFECPRVGMIIAGFEIPHVHIHVIPTWSMADLSFARVDTNPDPAEMDEAASKLRDALRELGYEQASDTP
jgi:diadenosine tetraphosphate (Ap4A) HIT family hydrolase